jgi:hypothetical protein
LTGGHVPIRERRVVNSVNLAFIFRCKNCRNEYVELPNGWHGHPFPAGFRLVGEYRRDFERMFGINIEQELRE